MSDDEPLTAGVVGVGSMGQNHARVYDDLAETELVGVHDADTTQARRMADDHGTEALSLDDLFDRADLVSIAVPTQYHYETARAALDAGVHALVEKPLVDDPAAGRDLVDRANRRDLTLQVGHIERFNPVVTALQDLVSDLDIYAVHSSRLGPPLDREIDDTAVMDLMIHDLDIVLSLLGDEVSDVGAVGTADNRYASANLQFESGVVSQLVASRVTQEKVRELTISARECRVKADYIDQTIEIHRQSRPAFLDEDDAVHYRHESVVEELTVEPEEPLKNELRSFATAVRTGDEPVVSGEDGLRALKLANHIDEIARSTPKVRATR